MLSRVAAPAALLALTACAHARPPPGDTRLAAVAWIAGAWRAEQDGRVTEEQWTRPEGGAMLGVARTIEGGRMVSFEYLRIEASEDGLVYVASPSGQATTRFVAPAAVTGLEVTFSNPEHDFPKSITYRLASEDQLCARIEGDGESAEWCWRRMVSEPR